MSCRRGDFQTWKSDSICAKASRSLARASVKRLLSFRSDFKVVSSWEICTLSAFSVAWKHDHWSFLGRFVMFFPPPCIFVLVPRQKQNSGVFHCSPCKTNIIINQISPSETIVTLGCHYHYYDYYHYFDRLHLRMALSFSKSLIFSLAWWRDCL